jgi:hypothetical protein
MIPYSATKMTKTLPVVKSFQFKDFRPIFEDESDQKSIVSSTSIPCAEL